jgi:hypothetical protein
VSASRAGSGKCALVLILLALPAVAGPLPKIERLSSYGCDIKQRGDAWEVHAWAEHEVPSGESGVDFSIVRDWQIALSRRSGGNGRKRALDDCSRFIAEAEKAVQARRGS